MTYFTMPLTATLPTARIRSELDRLFDDGFANRTSAEWTPPVDLRESAKDFTLEVELPGVSAQSVEVLAEDGYLTIKGEKAPRNAQEGERVLITQRASGTFARRFRLPKSADASKIDARMADGLLTVRVEKIAPAQPRKVTIQLNAEQEAVTTSAN